ncbi:MAG: penicillin-binding protein 2 [Lentisphaeria bacterium]|nr:penicillin-binding protein 2 [Lentisphaeria bacterium]
MHRGRTPDNARQGRIWLLGLVILLGMGGLVIRLWWVQIKQGPEHVERIIKQSIRDIRLPAVRGRILTRGGEVLADNQPSYDLIFKVEDMRRRGRKSATVNHILDRGALIAGRINRPSPLTEARVRRHIDWYPALPLTIFEKLNKRELTLALEHVDQTSGWSIRDGFIRTYPHGAVAAHVTGFTGITDPPDEEHYFYHEREPHGRAGLERFYDDILAGKAGRKTVRVDTLGYADQEANPPVAPENGVSLVLEMDLRAQQIAERLMAGKRGAFVLLNARTGGVLALVSAPGYNLNALTTDYYARLAGDTENFPLLNRAVSPGYMPGSIVKPLVALAAFEAGKLDADTTVVTCPGYFKMGDMRINCGRRSGHGDLTLRAAIAQSCNTFFIELGQQTGLEDLAKTFRQAGLGESPGLDIPGGGGAGLVPSRPWARERLGRAWIASDTAFISIGQGMINLSPLQAAVYTAAIANGGAVLKPRLVHSMIREDGQIVKKMPVEIRRRLTDTPAYLDSLRAGMDAVVNSDIGGAPEARNSVISVAGKTGTAEKGPRTERTKNTWFTGFAPIEDPRYAFTVIVEDGQSGGKTAAPIVSAFFDAWLTAR